MSELNSPPNTDTPSKAEARKLLSEHCTNMIHALEDGISRTGNRGNAPMRHESSRLKVLLDLFSANDPRIAEMIETSVHAETSTH